uniref:Myb/SANT-like DNA-binding domain-containing protein n=1 Tax=Anopheles triannulatus TaxID=58253 RepID=A0A2M4ASW6_9DIPT
MARRNVWTYEETKALLSVIKDKGLIRYFGEEQNKKLYGIVETEMRKRGFPDKGAFQIEHKWKNLKRVYYKTKREDYLSESCEFFEELDELMSEKLQQNQAKQARSDPTDTVTPKRPRPVLEHFDKLLAKIGAIERENNDEFFRKQKDLINYEFELYTQDERQFNQRLSSILEKNAEDFCFRAQQILILEGMIAGTVADVVEEKLDMVDETMDDVATAEETLEEAIEDADGTEQMVDVIEQLEEETVEMVEMVEEDDLEEDENEIDERKEVVKQYYQAWKEDEF